MNREQLMDRHRALIDAGIALTSELSLDALLQKLVEAAAELTGARYAAMGVIDQTGAALERFVAAGIDPDTHAAIGELPRGRGILGALIRDHKPLRLHDLSEDPRSVGFPPGHPPMKTFLGVPVMLRGIAYGNLYLTEKDGGEFTDEDQELVQMLASQAAVAIENARLYESATRWLRQLEVLNEVASALASETDLPRLLSLIAERLRELLAARAVLVALPGSDGLLRVAAAAGADADELHGFELGYDSKSTRVFERRRGERVDSILDDPEVNQERARTLGIRSAIWVPLVFGDRAIGLILVVDKAGSDPRFSDDDLRLAESFAQRAATAVNLSERVARDALRRVVEAQELERRRLARELHDEAGQALTSILLGLKTIEDVEDGEQAQRAVAEVRELVVATLQDVRRLAVELRPAALDDFGLVPALGRLVEVFADQTRIQVEFQSSLPDERLPSDVETALYRIVQEALTNVVKHARASRVTILLAREGALVRLVVEDNGEGFDPEGARGSGLGLLGMRERVGLLDGAVEIESSAGRGTTLAIEVPI